MIRIKDIEETTQASSISNAPASHHVPSGAPNNRKKVRKVISKVDGKKEEEEK